MTSVARRLSFQVLLDVEKSGAYPNIALQRALRTQTLYGDDRSLLTHIVYGTLQRRLTLDALLAPICTRDLSGLDVRVLTILRMTAYQLCFLSKVPAYAALNEAVELCKASIPKASGFVNGVLRNFVRDSRTVDEKLQDTIAKAGSWDKQQAIRYSFPEWLVRTWREDYGMHRAEAILRSSNEPAYLSVRVNRMKCDREALLADIHSRLGEGIAEPSRVSPDGIRLRVGFDVEQWDAYQQGWVSVQDEAAMLVAPLLEADRHRKILDMCAAPGTKTTQLAELQADSGDILAVDVHPHKVRLINNAAKRLGLHSIRATALDARTLRDSDQHRASYNAILVDAPCSGLGVLRHRPDIRWKRSEEDIRSLAGLQSELITTAMALVRPGGLMVYSTCTLTRTENERRLERALSDTNGSWVADDLSDLVPAPVYAAADKPGMGIIITPELFGTDGFFMARLRRVR